MLRRLHNFRDGFKKAFDTVWQTGLWQVLRGFNIQKGLVQAIHSLHENSSVAVLLNSQLGEFFKTTVSVRQGCSLSPILFNLFLEKITEKNTHHDHHTPISSKRHIERKSAQKRTKITTNRTSSSSERIISMHGQKSEGVPSFKYHVRRSACNLQSTPPPFEFFSKH